MGTQQTAALIQSVNNMTETVAGKMGQIDKRVDAAEEQFDEWRNKKDIVGEPGLHGTMRMSIFQGLVVGTGGTQGVAGHGHFEGKLADLGSSDEVYVHFKTPMNVNVDHSMFWFSIRGYSYGTAKIVDETIVGYCYSPSRTIINKSAFGGFNPESYADSSGNVILRIKVPAIYFTTIRIDTMKVGSSLFGLGSLTPKVSLSSTVEF